MRQVNKLPWGATYNCLPSRREHWVVEFKNADDAKEAVQYHL